MGWEVVWTRAIKPTNTAGSPCGLNWLQYQLMGRAGGGRRLDPQGWPERPQGMGGTDSVGHRAVLHIAYSYHSVLLRGLSSRSAARGNAGCLLKVPGSAFHHPETHVLLLVGRSGRPWNASVRPSSHPG